MAPDFDKVDKTKVYLEDVVARRWARRHLHAPAAESRR